MKHESNTHVDEGESELPTASSFSDLEPWHEEPEADGDVGSLVAVPEEFRIDGDEAAAWAVRKIVEVRHYGARVRDWAARETRRAEREEDWLLRRFGPELEGWLRQELRRRGGRTKSVPLPSGTVGLRRQPTRLSVDDERCVIAWCERHLMPALRVVVEAEGDAARELARWHQRHEDDARLTKRIMREPLAHHVAESGELPDGTTLVPAADRLYVK